MAFQRMLDTEDSDKFKFEDVGDSLEGYYLGSETITINGKAVTKHNFRVDNRTVSPLGSFDLDKKLAKVAAGTMTRVTYESLKKLKAGKTLKVYAIEIDEADVIATPGFAAAAPRASTSDKIAALKAQQLKTS